MDLIDYSVMGTHGLPVPYRPELDRVPRGPTELEAPLFPVLGVYRHPAMMRVYLTSSREAAEEFCRRNSGRGLPGTLHPAEFFQNWTAYYGRYSGGEIEIKPREAACDEGGRW